MSGKKERLCTTEICVFEVARGIFINGNKRELHSLIILLEAIEIIPTKTMFALDAAAQAGILKKKGITLDDNDLLIVGMMQNFGVKKIVTKNKRHFSKIKDLEAISY